MKKIRNTDLLFCIALSLGFLVHIFFVFIYPFLYDESFYVAVPFRLLNGDSLVQHEWNLTQFSSLFAYLPVALWTAIKGSADGILVFIRCIYLLIHTTVAIVVYRFFRKYGNWAILASIMYYAQLPYGMLSISYHSVLNICLLLLSFFLLSIYENKSVRLYIYAGICFGCCCVCNPFICVAFVLYLLICILWTKRQAIRIQLLKIKRHGFTQKGKKLTNREIKKLKQTAVDGFADSEKYDCFFSKDAFLRFSYGICIIAVIAIVFFLATGGTITSVIRNTENLLGSSEYEIVSQNIFAKFVETLGYFSEANLGMPWILPAIFAVMIFDKKRNRNTHRFIYLFASLIWAVIFIIAVVLKQELNAFSLPFCVISVICYVLTEKRNKTLFNCMYIPCLIATFFHYVAANTHLSAIGVLLAINNVVGVIFARDLWEEMQSNNKNEVNGKSDKKLSNLCRSTIIVGFCIQIVFYGMFYQVGKLPGKDAVKATTGPYAGLYMNEQQYNDYTKLINDMDAIRNITEEDDPVLILGFDNWPYLYLERPFATYTIWYEGALTVDSNQLINYYKENPEKIPEYVYIVASDLDSSTVSFITDKLSEVFKLSEGERLSQGVLLTVECCNF